MKFILLVFLFMSLANPISGGKLFPGFQNPEKWMKRVIRKLQRKSSAYGQMIASNTAGISNNAGFISSIAACATDYINNPDYGLSCCFEDTNNLGTCLCNGTTIDDADNPGSCCSANLKHPDHCLCSGTDMDDPNNPGNCCFKDSANPGQCLCNAANYTDDPNKRCFNLDWKGDGVCDDENNHGGCDFDGGDCCGEDVDTDLCTLCQCLEEEAPVPNAVGCCFEDSNNPGQCLCTGTEIDDPDNPGSCCKDDVDNPGNCFVCVDATTCNGNGTCIGNTGICECNGGFTGDGCDILTCPGKPICGGIGTCPEGGVVCDCGDAAYVNADCSIDNKYILITSGSGSRRSEVIDAIDDTKRCADLPDFPVDDSYLPPGGVVDGKVIVCKGRTGMSPNTADCYRLEDDASAWTSIATVNKITWFNGGVVIKGTDGNPDKLWVMNDQSTYIFSDGTAEVGPAIADGADGGMCVVFLKTTGEVMILGGWPKTRRTLRFNPANETFTTQGDMIGRRHVHACATFYSAKHGGREVIYVGGGRGGSQDDNDADTAELLDYTVTETWESLPNLPEKTNHGPKALTNSNGDGVLHFWVQKTFELTCDTSSCSWKTRQAQIQNGRTRLFQAIYIPDGLATDCT